MKCSLMLHFIWVFTVYRVFHEYKELNNHEKIIPGKFGEDEEKVPFEAIANGQTNANYGHQTFKA